MCLVRDRHFYPLWVLGMTLNCLGCDGLPMFVDLTTSTSNDHHGAAPVVAGLGGVVLDTRALHSKTPKGSLAQILFSKSTDFARAKRIASIPIETGLGPFGVLALAPHP